MLWVVLPLLHAYVDPVLPASNVTVPLHTFWSAPRLTVGAALIVTKTEADAEQPLFTVTEYVPLVSAVMVWVVAPVFHT